MNNRICILKAGHAIDEVCRQIADFEELIARRMEYPLQGIDVVDLAGDTEARVPERPAGVIITGARLMVADRGGIFFRLISLAGMYLKKKVPILGICYGHQVLASLFGGSIAYLDGGVEIGTVAMARTAAGTDDELFSVLPEHFYGHASHRETVASASVTSLCCAKGERDAHHALSFGEGAWGIQFHPEFTEEVMRLYLSSQRESLEGEGCNVDHLLQMVRYDDAGPLLLRRFRDICLGGREV